MAEQGKQPGALKKAWRLMSLNIDKRFNESFEDDGFHKEIRSGYAQLFTLLRARRANPGHFPASFPELLLAWQIPEDSLPVILRNMLVEIFFLVMITGLMLFSAFAGYGGLLFSGLLFCLGLAMLSAVVMRYWRYSILKQQVAVPFMQWMGFGSDQDQTKS